MYDPYAEFESTELPNGLKVYARSQQECPWQIVGFLIHSGAEHDPVGLEGVAHFVEHLVSENAPLPKEEIRSFADELGGEVCLGMTGYYYTEYRFMLPADVATLSKGFSIFGNMLLHAKLANLIERERKVIIAEFLRKYPSNIKLDMELRERRMLYPGDLLSRHVRPLGSPESISCIQQSDLQEFYDKHYVPANISVVGVGALNLSQMVYLLEQSPFAVEKKGVHSRVPAPSDYVFPPEETMYEYSVSEHTSVKADAGSYRSVAKIPGKYNRQTISLLSKMLSKILTDELREKRSWTYSVGTNWFDLRHLYEFAICCDAAVLSAIDEIHEVVNACIRSVSEREDLFLSVRRRTIAGECMVDLRGIDLCLGAMRDLRHARHIISIEEYVEGLRRVTMDDIKGACQWLAPDNRWTILTRE